MAAREICEDKSSGDFYNQIQSYESNPDIFNLTTGMEMIGFSKSLQQQSHQNDSNNPAVMWKGFFTTTSRPPCDTNLGPSSSSSSKMVNESTSGFYPHDQNLMVGVHDNSASGAWEESNNNRTTSLVNIDESSLRCVFPCEGNERPSQGLSLSLSSSNPSSIGLQSFELRQTMNHNHHQMVQAMHHHHQGGQFFQLRNSKYLVPAQELLNEFCSLGTKQINDVAKQSKKNKQWDDYDNNASSSNSSRKQSQLYSLDFIELQKRKTKLLSMLEELDRRYRHYRDQMKAVVSSFEAVAGNGAASVYSALASKAMSKHFRCLRDGIVGQIHATRKAMGEKDPVAPGTSRGETPRLRILDQTLRQQRAFQQISMMENHPWRPQRGLPERSVSVLRAWLFEHFLHPYPNDVDKHILARQTGLSRSQVSNWFINARVRLWKPMVEEMYLEELKEQENSSMAAGGSSDGGGSRDGINDQNHDDGNHRMNQDLSITDDRKPTAEQLVRIDSESLSSIVNTTDKSNESRNPKPLLQTSQTLQQLHHQQQQNFGSSFGAVELDFSAYNHHAVAGVSYGNTDTTAGNQNFNGGGGGVSLTLGLQQHGGSGVNLAFSQTSQSSLFYPRDHIEDCQQVQYSLLDGDQAQNLPYRNLMGAQLLHDLAG